LKPSCRTALVYGVAFKRTLRLKPEVYRYNNQRDTPVSLFSFLLLILLYYYTTKYSSIVLRTIIEQNQVVCVF
ncbi:MAG: hypothetical protein NUV54_00715, partial [Candidatus Taylorbacteria bacterium]|nr:hypothetical protein [Candidatus Taylorbacteria bacterium]